MTQLPYRPNVCMILLQGGKIFLGERTGSPGSYQFPQGGREEGTLEENALRELEEELGARQELFQILALLDAVNRYDFQRTPDYAKGKWRGQEQRFVVVKFLGEDKDITLQAQCPEFDSFRWVHLEELPSLVENIRYPGYVQALEEARQKGFL